MPFGVRLITLARISFPFEVSVEASYAGPEFFDCPAIRMPVPTGTPKAGQTIFGLRSVIGRFSSKQYWSRASLNRSRLFE